MIYFLMIPISDKMKDIIGNAFEYLGKVMQLL